MAPVWPPDSTAVGWSQALRRAGRPRSARRSASGSPTTLTSATAAAAVGVEHQLAGRPTMVTMGLPPTARMVSGSPPSPGRCPAAPAPRRPGPVGTRRGPAASAGATSIPRRPRRGLGRSCGASPARRTSSWWTKNSVVLAPSSTPGMAKTENRAGPLRIRLDQLGELPALLHLGHPAFEQPRQRLGHHAGRTDRIGLADPQVRCQIVGGPALAQRRCVRSDRVEQVAQLSPLGLGKGHEDEC